MLNYNYLFHIRRILFTGLPPLMFLTALTRTPAAATNVTILDGYSGNVIPNNSALYSPANDNGPMFRVQVQGSPAYIYFQFSFNYTDQHGLGFIYSETYQLGNGTWTLPFPGLGGNPVYITWNDVCGGQGGGSLSLTVYGTNPPLNQVQQSGATWNYPWFWPMMVNLESGGVQYATSTWSNDYQNRNIVSMPLWGPPDGIGVTQVDGTIWALAYNDYFSWNKNIEDGLGILFSKQSSSASWMNTQIQQNQQDNGPVPYISPYGYCQAGFGEADDERPLSDAEWITEYNGGHVLTWNRPNGSSPGYWSTNYGYLASVCSKAPLF